MYLLHVFLCPLFSFLLIQKPTSMGNMSILKKVEDLEVSLRKLEEEKSNMKQENAMLVS